MNRAAIDFDGRVFTGDRERFAVPRRSIRMSGLRHVLNLARAAFGVRVDLEIPAEIVHDDIKGEGVD